MFSRFTFVLALTPLFMSTASANERADYGLSIGVSPFGASLSGSLHTEGKTSYQATIGGLPSSSAPIAPTVEGTEYEVTSGLAWVGGFLIHRPFDDAEWFHVTTGVGFGKISNELEDDKGNTYSANYTENPVGYVGIGFGNAPKKGFVYGFDLGWLQTGGPDIFKTAGPSADDMSDAIGDTFFFGSALPNAQLSLGWGF